MEAGKIKDQSRRYFNSCGFYVEIIWVIKVEKELKKVKSTHLRNYDYSNTGVYFVTICIEGHKQILSEITKAPDTAVSRMKTPKLVGELLAASKN